MVNQLRKRKLVLVIDTLQYYYHSHLEEIICTAAKNIEEIESVEVVDMAKQLPLHEQFYKIEAARADLIITADLAGWQLRTESESLSYNQLPCRMAHLLFEHIEKYKTLLREPFNFSMFFYLRYQEDMERVTNEYENIPNAILFESVLGNPNSYEVLNTKKLLKQILEDTA